MGRRPADGAALVVRVWREPGVAGFRGRVTYTTDATETGETVIAVDSPERVHAAVQEWLDEFLSAASPKTVDNGPDLPQACS